MGNNSWLDKLISVAVALMLWVYVVYVLNPLSQTVVSNVPVLLLNQEVLAASQLAIAGPEHYTVDVVVEGTRSDTIALKDDQVTATADLFGMGKGQNYLVVSVSVPEKITVIEIRANRIPVYVDELVNIAKPVELAVSNSSSSSEVGGIVLSPADVHVSGAKSIVDQVKSVRVTVPLDSLAETPSAQLLTAEPVDEEGQPVAHVRLSHAYVELTAALFRTKTVPLEVPVEGAVPEYVEITKQEIPSEITIKGRESALQHIQAVVARPLDIRGVRETTTLPIEPLLPEGIEVATSSLDLEAHFTVKTLSEVEFTYTPEDVWAYNVPAGYSVSVLTPGITVRARGEEAVVNVLKESDLQPAVNAANVSAGIQEVPATTRYAQQHVDVVVAPENIRIRVYKTSEEPESM